MHPRIDEVLQHLETQRGALRRAVDSVPVDLRSERPAPDRWSVANVVEHLAILEARVLMVIAQKIEEARAAGLGQDTETASVVNSVNVARVLDRTERIMSPERGQPTGTLDAADALARLEGTRVELIAATRAVDGLALQDVSFAHPVLGPLNMYQWLATVGWHEARHTAQIVEVREALMPGA